MLQMLAPVPREHSVRLEFLQFVKAEIELLRSLREANVGKVVDQLSKFSS